MQHQALRLLRARHDGHDAAVGLRVRNHQMIAQQLNFSPHRSVGKGAADEEHGTGLPSSQGVPQR